MMEDINKQIEAFERKDSDWVFDQVEYIYMHTDNYQPTRGTSYIPLPKFLKDKKAIINVKNEKDNECFKWAITCAVFTASVHPEEHNEKNERKLQEA